MKLSISIMAHPKRQEHFPYLEAMTGNAPMTIDHDSNGEWWNCQRAWALYDKTSDFHVVIQDDAIICRDFKARAEAVIEQAKALLKTEDFAVNFYYGKRLSAIKQAEEAKRKGYWINSAPKWGVAICLPTKHIESMLEYTKDGGNPAWGTKDDVRVGSYIISQKMPVYFPFPSLIDHRSGKSLVGDPGENRHCYQFID